MKTTYKLTVVFTAVIVLVVGASYFWASSSLDEKNNKISSLQEDINSKENEIASLESDIDNMSNFEGMLLKGIGHVEDALANKGYASSDYDDFSRNYDGGYYEVAQTYADSADTYYGYAKSDMEDAKSRFEQARKYAPSEKYRRLIENYIKAADYGIQIWSEMRQAGEYFSSACGYYADGNWTTGDDEVEVANEHIVVHDNLIDNYNAYLSNIDAILDDW